MVKTKVEEVRKNKSSPMPSLTPKERADEVTGLAIGEGIIAGCLALVPSCGGVYFAMKNPTFLRVSGFVVDRMLYFNNNCEFVR